MRRCSSRTRARGKLSRDTSQGHIAGVHAHKQRGVCCGSWGEGVSQGCHTGAHAIEGAVGASVVGGLTWDGSMVCLGEVCCGWGLKCR